MKIIKYLIQSKQKGGYYTGRMRPEYDYHPDLEEARVYATQARAESALRLQEERYPDAEVVSCLEQTITLRNGETRTVTVVGKLCFAKVREVLNA